MLCCDNNGGAFGSALSGLIEQTRLLTNGNYGKALQVGHLLVKMPPPVSARN